MFDEIASAALSICSSTVLISYLPYCSPRFTATLSACRCLRMAAPFSLGFTRWFHDRAGQVPELFVPPMPSGGNEGCRRALCAAGLSSRRAQHHPGAKADVAPLTETVIDIPTIEEGVADENSRVAAQQLNWSQGRVVHRAGWWPLNGAWWRCFDRPWGRTLHRARGRALYGARRRSVDRARWWPFDRPWGRTLHGTRGRALYGARRRSVDRPWRWTLDRPQALLQQHPATSRIPAGTQETRLCG